MPVDASQVAFSAEDPTKWLNDVDPGDVDDALDQLAAEKAAVTGLPNVDNAIMRADGTLGDIQDSNVILADSGAMTEVESVVGETGTNFVVRAVNGGGQTFTARGGVGSATGNGGKATVAGGGGGATSGDGGDVTIIGGKPVAGDGGDILITGEAGVGTNKSGGNVTVTAGDATGSGTPGKIILASSTVFNEASADKDFRMESNGDAYNFFSDGGNNRCSVGVVLPLEKFQVTDAIALSNNTEGNTARLTHRTSHDVVTLTAGQDTTTISIPSGARILAVSMNVNTAVITTGIGNNLWSAAFITGSTTNIVTDESEALNTKTDKMIPDEITTDTTQIRFTPKGGTFSAGVIEVVAYYEELTSLADV